MSVLDRAIYTPLFTENSHSLQSRLFTVLPGQVAILQAFGFLDKKYRAPENVHAELAVQQAACLEMVLFAEGHNPPPDCGCQIYDLNEYNAYIIAQEQVRRNCADIMLSKEQNMMLLAVPGTYCFTLNDPTAVGAVRIFMRIIPREDYPWNSKFFIGE